MFYQYAACRAVSRAVAHVLCGESHAIVLCGVSSCYNNALHLIFSSLFRVALLRFGLRFMLYVVVGLNCCFVLCFGLHHVFNYVTIFCLWQL